VLIDPSYEDKQDYARTLDTLKAGLERTPFHNMMLVCPDTPETAIAALVDGVEAVLEALRG